MTKNNLSLAVLLFLCAFMAFSPSLKNDFINWDDSVYIVDNSNVQQLSWHNLKIIFTTSIRDSYHPLTQLSFAVEHYFVQLNPWLYHLDNLILHALNAVLVFTFISLFAARDIAFITALLFGIHPLRVESVAWVAERKDVLFAFFYLCALIQYSIFVKNKHTETGRLYLCLGLFVPAVLAKPQALSLPLALLSIDYLFQRKWDISILREKLPFFAVSLLSILPYIFNSKRLLSKQTIPGSEVQPLIDNFFLSFYAVLTYACKCIAPLNMSAIHFYPVKIDEFLPFTVYLAPVIILISFIALYKMQAPRPIIWAVLFFCVTITLPLLNIWVGGNFIADRYTYLPDIGVSFIVGSLMVVSYKRYPPIKWLFLIYACFLFVSSFTYCGIWKNASTLYADIIRQDTNTTFTNNIQGELYAQNGQFNQAMDEFNKIIKRTPRYPVAYYNRGNMYAQQEDFLKAIDDYSKAIELSPYYEEAYNNRGCTYLILNNPEAAVKDFEQSLVLFPDEVNTLVSLGVAYTALKKDAQALNAFEKALSLDPNALKRPGIINLIQNQRKRSHVTDR